MRPRPRPRYRARALRRQTASRPTASRRVKGGPGRTGSSRNLFCPAGGARHQVLDFRRALEAERGGAKGARLPKTDRDGRPTKETYEDPTQPGGTRVAHIHDLTAMRANF